MLASRAGWFSLCWRVLLPLSLVVGWTPASADLAHRVDQNVGGLQMLVLSGTISDNEDIDAIAAAVLANRVSRVTFNSEGGSATKAMELGRRIRSLRLDTYQTRASTCTSACVLAFLGGVKRFAGDRSLGLTKSSFDDVLAPGFDIADPAAQQLIRYLNEMDVNPQLLLFADREPGMVYLSAHDISWYQIAFPVVESQTEDPGDVEDEDYADDGHDLAPLYVMYREEQTATEPEATEPGTALWSFDDLMFGDGRPSQRSIRAAATIPGKDMRVSMTISRNTQPGIVASHIIKLVFELPKDFEGGGVADVVQVTMKYLEESPGDAITGQYVQAHDHTFLVALDPDQAAIDRNVGMLENRPWIDVALVYKSGRRAVLTMKSGLHDDEVTAQTFETWQKEMDAAGGALPAR